MTSKLYNSVKYASNSELRNMFLNPKGLVPQQIGTLPRKKRNYDFLNWKQELHRIGPGKEVEKNVATFVVDTRMTKPEIKQYIEKVYKIEVDRVNTVISHSKIRKDLAGRRYRNQDIKKAYVFMKGIHVPEFFRKASFFTQN